MDSSSSRKHYSKFAGLRFRLKERRATGLVFIKKGVKGVITGVYDNGSEETSIYTGHAGELKIRVALHRNEFELLSPLEQLAGAADADH